MSLLVETTKGNKVDDGFADLMNLMLLLTRLKPFCQHSLDCFLLSLESLILSDSVISDSKASYLFLFGSYWV